MRKVHLKRKQAFTLIELLVVITIIAVLASLATPAYTRIQENAKISKDVNNVRQIILGCRAFSADEEGAFPWGMGDDEESGSEDGSASSSVDAFNDLIPDYIDSEAIFWIRTKNPDKQSPPIENDELESEECTFAYCAGQFDTSFSRSPLVADGEMDGPGTYGEFHPWLRSRKAVVGFVGGHVKPLKLTQSTPGATVMSEDKQIEDIFQEKSQEEGGESGGLLDTEQSNVLLPE
ncbi:MAG: type II secretion system protein [Verrucomicrobiales bacterium]|nr:type II secretion system protein [Verrucomicrobiales bacterium]